MSNAIATLAAPRSAISGFQGSFSSIASTAWGPALSCNVLAQIDVAGRSGMKAVPRAVPVHENHNVGLTLAGGLEDLRPVSCVSSTTCTGMRAGHAQWEDSLIHELIRSKSKESLATLSIGGGPGIALATERSATPPQGYRKS